MTETTETRPRQRMPSNALALFGALRLRAKLVFLTAASTAAVMAAAAFVTIRYVRSQMLQIVTEANSTQSDALRVVLEEQMRAGDRRLLNRLVDDIGKEPGIAWIGLLDPQGRVRVSSNPAMVGQVRDVSSPDCQICHAHRAAERRRSVTLLGAASNRLRTVTPLLNRVPCQRCHGKDRRINGVLIIDRSLSRLQQALLATETHVLLGGGIALLALLASLGLALERLVLLRLARLGSAARGLGQGDLRVRAEDKSTDELGDLAREFNAMADRLAETLSVVATERRQLDELVNGISDGVVLVDTALQVRTMNRAFAARLGPAALRSLGAGYVALVRAAGLEMPEGTPPLAERALKSGAIEKQIVSVGRANEERFEEIYAQPLRGADGAITSVIEVWRDITDRLALEAGLEQSERLAALGILASGIAHEVGNPLASIATAVEGLLRRLDQTDGSERQKEIREYLEIISKQVFRCHSVTERLLGFARLPSRKVANVDAVAAAREVIALVTPRARAQQVEIRAELPDTAPVVAEDLLLEQVFLNLVINALQAMPTGGVLTIEARTDAESITVIFSDSGPGIARSSRPHLFRPFRSGRSDGAGTGLGLFLSQTLVQRCGGTISVASEPGQGAAFIVRLRRAGQDADEPSDRR